MSMLAVAANIGVATATLFTCGVGLVQGTGTWCGLHWTWLIGFPLALIAVISLCLPLNFLLTDDFGIGTIPCCPTGRIRPEAVIMKLNLIS
jgi:hypothetical protein